MGVAYSPSVAQRTHRVRVEHTNHLRFLTFSCFQRLALFKNDAIKDAFVDHLGAAREKHRFHLIAWVVMPEHVHLLLWPRLPEAPVSAILRTLKQRFAQQVIARWRTLRAPIFPRIIDSGGVPRFWLRGGGHDRNVWSDEEIAEKIAYIHRNPVTRGLVRSPEEWKWSSARWYAGMREGELPIDPIERPM